MISKLKKKMKKQFLFLLMAAFIVNANAQNAANIKKLDSLFDALYNNNKAMGSFAIRQNNKTVYTKATGFIDDNKTPANINSIYRIGSVSKMYTAAIVFQAVEEGKLGMETTLDTYYPAIPNASKIKVKHLLAHTSGIFNITSDSTFESWYEKPQTKNQMLQRIQQYKPVFEPGTDKEYSNSNYILLGYIMESVYKKTLAELIANKVNSKTGATFTKPGAKINSAKNEAHSFSFEDAKWKIQPETDMSVPQGAGAIVSTAEEVALFSEKYISGKILNKQWTDTLLSFTKTLGYGIMKVNINDSTTAFGHNGAIDGFNSFALYFPKQDLSICFLSNGINYSIKDIITAAWLIYNGKEYNIPSFKTIQLTETDLVKYKGTYSTPKMDLTITVDSKDGNMLVQASGQQPFKMDTESATTFSNGQIGLVLEFKLNTDGSIKEMLLKQGGGELIFTKEK